jgi:hypothetical protein
MHALGNQDWASALIVVELALYTARDDLLDRVKIAQAGKQEELIKRVLRSVQPRIGFNNNAVQQTIREIEANINDPARWPMNSASSRKTPSRTRIWRS